MTENIVDVAKASPPVAITSLSLFGIPISEWVYFLTAVYTILLIIGWFIKYFGGSRGEK